MTCIVAVTDGKTVHMAADRGASDGHVILKLAKPKIHKNGEYLIGYAGSMSGGQLLQSIALPAIPKKELHSFMRTGFLKALRDAIENYGIGTSEADESVILVACRGRIFEISPSDWSVAEWRSTAIGSGAPVALGAMYVMESNGVEDYKTIVTTAVEAACELSPTCKLPIDYETI